ncbi:(2Fe-2S)-binding protein [Sphaerochaeta pleomorpha]|nr:(2Fe-2S)-binding protein [Sphaerochaeta pleomorpha]
MDWKTAPGTEMVCYCKQVDKGTIVSAIERGNDSLAKIQEATKACTGGNCKVLNPSHSCCSPDILELIRIYSSKVKKEESCCCCSCS